jgi:hypothetical protein
MQTMILMQLCHVIHAPVSFQTASALEMELLFQVTWTLPRLQQNHFFKIVEIQYSRPVLQHVLQFAPYTPIITQHVTTAYSLLL